MKKILITGATGFIGHFLVEEALRRGYAVTATVRRSSRFEDLEKQNVQVVPCEFSDVDQLNRTFANLPRFDFVIHNAGLTKALSDNDYLEVNCGNTIRFIKALQQSAKTPDKFLLMSSLAAFGPGDPESGEPILLTSTPRPVTAYGRSKLAAETYLIEKTRLSYTIIRPTAVYGPREKDIFKMIQVMRYGIALKIGRKDQRLTFIYVKDLARLVFDALESPLIRKAYFAADGNLYDNSDLARIVGKALGRKIFSVSVPVWFTKRIVPVARYFSRLSGEIPVLNSERIHELAARNWNCDVEPLRCELNFKARYDLEAGMYETIDWYKKEHWLN